MAREDQIFLFDNAGVSEMGTRVDKRMGEIGEYFKDKDLTPEQRAIVDVFSGKQGNAAITFTDAEGQERTLHIRSGNENKGGVKHAIFRHYNSGQSNFSAEDIAKINTILEQGQRTEKENGNVEYKYTDESGCTYTVVSGIRNGIEGFVTFYTNKEALPTTSQNTQLSAQEKENASNSTAKLQQKSETTKSEDKIELLQTPNGTVYGWSIGNEIWLTDEGMNPETPIHEYTHLFAKQMQQADAKAWKQVVSLCKKAKELWDAVKNDPNYSHLTTDDEIASEVLSRYSGKRGSQQAVGTAEQMAKEGKSFESDASAKVLIGRINKALEAFWGWVTDKLGISHKYKSLDEVADKSLHDLLSGSEIEIADFTGEEQELDQLRDGGQAEIDDEETADEKAGEQKGESKEKPAKQDKGENNGETDIKRRDVLLEQLAQAMDDEDFDKVAQLNGEISVLNKRIAEMQRGKGVMSNATPAQRFVTNVLMKALNRIKGVKVHHATQADVERVMAQVKAKKPRHREQKNLG